MYHYDRNTRWTEFLTSSDYALLDALGKSVSDRSNVLTDALSEMTRDEFITALVSAGWEDYDALTDGDYRFTSRAALARLATVLQMIVFDRQNGPESDGKSKALRRHWYAWYKVGFAQPLALALGDYKVNSRGIKEIDDLAWTGRLSQTYAYFVDNMNITYKDLWVEDASRMMLSTGRELFRGANIILAVEKDSLFSDFEAAARALGAVTLYSGKGKSSKAAMEKVLRDHFRWERDQAEHWQKITYDNPLVVLHISDHDFDGEAVIGPTFAEQARRYTPYIIEARVGIKPESVIDAGYRWDDKWYQVKVSNKGYQTWAEEKALFMVTCDMCGHEFAVHGAVNYYGNPWACEACGAETDPIDVSEVTPHGFEVEALRTRDYYALVVYAYLSVVPFEHVISRLRDECKASAYNAAHALKDKIIGRNKSYQDLLKMFDDLEAIKDEFERRIVSTLETLGEDHEDDWRNLGDDPEQEDFVAHVENSAGNSWVEPWRPFDPQERTNELVKWIGRNHADITRAFIDEELEF